MIIHMDAANDIDVDRIAYSGGAIPDGLDYVATLRFLMLRTLYQYAKAAEMTRDQGAREKRYVEAVAAKYRADMELAKYHANVMLHTGRALSDYRKARNVCDNAAALEAADNLVEALDNIPIKGVDADEKRT